MKHLWLLAYRTYRVNRKFTTQPAERAAVAVTAAIGINWNTTSQLLDALKIASAPVAESNGHLLLASL